MLLVGELVFEETELCFVELLSSVVFLVEYINAFASISSFVFL